MLRPARLVVPLLLASFLKASACGPPDPAGLGLTLEVGPRPPASGAGFRLRGRVEGPFAAFGTLAIATSRRGRSLAWELPTDEPGVFAEPAGDFVLVEPDGSFAVELGGGPDTRGFDVGLYRARILGTETVATAGLPASRQPYEPPPVVHFPVPGAPEWDAAFPSLSPVGSVPLPAGKTMVIDRLERCTGPGFLDPTDEVRVLGRYAIEFQGRRDDSGPLDPAAPGLPLRPVVDWGLVLDADHPARHWGCSQGDSNHWWALVDGPVPARLTATLFRLQGLLVRRVDLAPATP